MHQYNIDKALKYTLAQRISKATEWNIISDIIVKLWQQIAQQVEPVIGIEGTKVLYIRALHLTHKQFPSVVITDSVMVDKSNNTVLIQDFLNSFKHQDTNLIRKASYALLETFTQLLIALIGESLTNQLLNPVFVPDIKSEA